MPEISTAFFSFSNLTETEFFLLMHPFFLCVLIFITFVDVEMQSIDLGKTCILLLLKVPIPIYVLSTALSQTFERVHLQQIRIFLFLLRNFKLITKFVVHNL